MLNFKRIHELAKTPRDVNEPELEEAFPIGLLTPFFGGKDKVNEERRTAPVVLAAVVQANECLWDPEEASWSPAVLVFTTDPTQALNPAYISGIAERLAALRDHPSGDPGAKKVSELLNDEHSDFTEPVPESAVGAKNVFWCVEAINPSVLPNGCLPEDGILPCFVTGSLPNDFSLSIIETCFDKK